MRFILSTFVFVSALAAAAELPSGFTYLHGSVDGISENSVGTLDLASMEVLVLHAPTVSLEVPYTAIAKTTRKPVSEKESSHKLWGSAKKFEEVYIEFKDKNGKAANITLELHQQQADLIVGRAERAEQHKSLSRGDFWGDRVWKTKRNQDRWAGEVATRE